MTSMIKARRHRGLLVDVGANYGYFSRLWLCKSDTFVIAIEPVPEYVAMLERNLRQYAGRHRIFAGCIGDHSGTAILDTIGSDATMLTRVIEKDEGVSGRTLHAEMRTLPELMTQFGVEYIDVLKVDSEGFDIKILNSARTLFQANSIGIVFWERTMQKNEEELEAFLESLGYERILDSHMIGYLCSTDKNC